MRHELPFGALLKLFCRSHGELRSILRRITGDEVVSEALAAGVDEDAALDPEHPVYRAMAYELIEWYSEPDPRLPPPSIRYELAYMVVRRAYERGAPATLDELERLLEEMGEI